LVVEAGLAPLRFRRPCLDRSRLEKHEKKAPENFRGLKKFAPDRPLEVHPGAFQQFTSISRMDASKIKKEAPAGGCNRFEWFHFHGFILPDRIFEE
jgi:hypothetical protein